MCFKMEVSEGTSGNKGGGSMDVNDSKYVCMYACIMGQVDSSIIYLGAVLQRSKKSMLKKTKHMTHG